MQALASISEKGTFTPPTDFDHPPSVLHTGKVATSAPEARIASLALVSAVTTMAPRHVAALRCHAMAFSALGHLQQALARANQAVSVAQDADRSSNVVHCTQTSSGIIAPPISGGKGNGFLVSTAIINGRCASRAIGFMPNSKAEAALGRLLLTGGGRPTLLDLAKSLVLRGCLLQKMGRRVLAQEDYHRALEVCERTLSYERTGQSDIEVKKEDAMYGGTCCGYGTPKQDPRERAHEGKAEGSQSKNSLTLADIWRTKAMIHHNLTVLHIAALCCGDFRATFHKVCRCAPHWCFEVK